MNVGGVETEVKLRISDVSVALLAIQSAGFAISRSRQFESNVMFDRNDGKLRAAGLALRLRDEAGVFTLTQKGPATRGQHKTREENELTVSNRAVMQLILENLGYAVTFRYEKYRTEFRHASQTGLVLLDETPIGAFLELEGQGDWINASATMLGFSESGYITDSYSTLYLQWCRDRGQTPGDMVFAS